MSSIWGERLKISLFGESHGNSVGVVIDGLPAGFSIDEERLKDEMKRRAPGSGRNGSYDGLTTPRSEADEYEIQSGFVEGHTTGTPLCAVIKNTNTHSKDYSELKIKPRPGHADYSGFLRYGGMNDIRGGGHFSARVTAGLMFAGAVARQILKSKDIYIGAHLKSVYGIEDEAFSDESLNEEQFETMRKMRLPMIDRSKSDLMAETILKARREGDSVGGVIEAAIIGLPGGVGDPFFDSVESKLAHIIFSIPGVKGIEFGAGFNMAKMKGSEANDAFYTEDGKIKTYTNNNGGINGGITNGMPVIFSTVLKPTPSIAKEQKTVNLKEMQNTELFIRGRHDPCIAVRGVPVIEAAAAICILDILMSGGIIR